jgi:hypothetical protein
LLGTATGGRRLGEMSLLMAGSFDQGTPTVRVDDGQTNSADQYGGIVILIRPGDK